MKQRIVNDYHTAGRLALEAGRFLREGNGFDALQNYIIAAKLYGDVIRESQQYADSFLEQLRINSESIMVFVSRSIKELGIDTIEEAYITC